MSFYCEICCSSYVDISHKINLESCRHFLCYNCLVKIKKRSCPFCRKAIKKAIWNEFKTPPTSPEFTYKKMRLNSNQKHYNNIDEFELSSSILDVLY